MKTLIIEASLRHNSNSDYLANLVAETIKDDVEVISLKDKTINFCIGCLACQKLGKCHINDDVNEIMFKMCKADRIIFSSPVYYYSIAGQLKTLLDRCNALYNLDYQFKEVDLLLSAAEDDSYASEGAIKAIEGWVECFPKAKLVKTFFAGGVGLDDKIKDHPTLNEITTYFSKH